jgi:drug/metabolite transporter (DMT)-like permease
MVVCATLVSTSFTVGAAITAELDPAVLTLLRFVFAALILAPYIHFRHGLRTSWSFVLRCSVISSCLVLFFWCMFLALRYTTALNTSVIFTLAPSFSGIYALILVGERLRRPQLIALLCGMVGAVWVIFRGDFSMLLAMEWNKGDMIFLGGCFAMGLYTPLVRLLHRGEDMLLMTFWVLVTGSCWLLLFGGHRLFSVYWQEIPAFAWSGIGYLAFFTTVITFFLTQYCIPYLGPTRVMAYSYLYPGLVLLLDLAFGHGLPETAVLPGVFIVLLAMLVLQRSL